jgi:hypothetical protein
MRADIAHASVLRSRRADRDASPQRVCSPLEQWSKSSWRRPNGAPQMVACAVPIDAIRHRLPAGRGCHGMAAGHMLPGIAAASPAPFIVRRGTRYFLHEPRVNSDSAIKSHDKVSS